MSEPRAFTYHDMALLQTEHQLNKLHIEIHSLQKQKADIQAKLDAKLRD